MRWNVRDDDPPIACSGGLVLLDGRPVEKVTAFDEEGGWVEALCVDGHTGRPGCAHVDPANQDEVCKVLLWGRVEYRAPE